MANQAIVIGLGRYGQSLAKELYTLGFDVLGMDIDRQVAQDFSDQLTYAVEADATSESVLREMGVPNFDLGVVAIGTDIQSSVMATLLLKTLGVKHVVARANNDLHASTLEKLGADRVVYPEQEAGHQLAQNLFNPNVREYVEITKDFGISEFKPPDHIIGITLEEAGLGGTRDKYGIAVLAIKRGRDPILFPAKDEIVEASDTLFVAGKTDLLARVTRGEAPPSKSRTASKVS